MTTTTRKQKQLKPTIKVDYKLHARDGRITSVTVFLVGPFSTDAFCFQPAEIEAATDLEWFAVTKIVKSLSPANMALVLTALGICRDELMDRGVINW